MVIGDFLNGKGVQAATTTSAWRRTVPSWRRKPGRMTWTICQGDETAGFQNVFEGGTNGKASLDEISAVPVGVSGGLG